MSRLITVLLLVLWQAPAHAGEIRPGALLHLPTHEARQAEREDTTLRLRALTRVKLRDRRVPDIHPAEWPARPFVATLRRSEEETRVVVGVKLRFTF